MSLEKKFFEFEKIIKVNNSFASFKDFLKKNLIISLILFLIVFIIGTTNNNLYIIFVSFVFIPIPFLVFFFLELFRFEQKKKFKEKFIADILLQASSFPSGTSIIEIIQYLSNTNYGLLSLEFKKCLNQINNGFSVEDALLEFKQRNNSKQISRAIDLLIDSENIGSDCSSSFKEIAINLIESQNVLRERQSILLVEKYTIFFAGALIIPLILGLVAGLVAKMDFSFIAQLGLGASELQRKQLFETALIANQLYIFEYALIASVFVGFQENNPSKAVIYAIILIPLGLISYHLTRLFF